MIQVRRGIFETNSSSTHSLTICTKEEFEKWKRGEMWFDRDYERLVEKKFVVKLDEEESKAHYINTHPSGYYYKTWEELSEEEIEKWHKNFLSSKKSKIESSYDYQTYDQWYFNSYDGLEKFDYEYTTPSGDNIVVFGKYGYD